jgi:Kef-type K+ transport system membrane component KefB
MNVMNHLHADPIAGVLLYGSLILFFGIMGRHIALRANQPGVLGELLMGVVIGNLCYFLHMPLAIIFRDSSSIYTIIQNVLEGATLEHSVYTVFNNSDTATQILAILQGPNGSELVNIVYVIDVLARYGVIFLLFMVGLDSSLSELKQTGVDAIRVAVIGVIAPIILGLCLLYFLMPTASFSSLLFVAATLSATSVGITARVLRDFNKLHTSAAKTILSAAMLDDLLGLIILAIVSGVVISGAVSFLVINKVLFLAIVFVCGAFLVGPWLVKHMVRWFAFLPAWEAKILTAFLFVTLLSWLATIVQLATIIGAFTAGVILKIMNKLNSVLNN